MSTGSISAIKSILIPIEDHNAVPAGFEAARLVACIFDSYIEGIAVRSLADSFVTFEPVGGFSFSSEYGADVANQARSQFETFMQTHGVSQARREQVSYSYGWPQKEAVEPSYIGRRGRVFDLIVLGRPGPAPENLRMTPLEIAMFDSGRPVLIVPPLAPQTLARNVLVAWDRSIEQAHTNTFALPLQRLADQVTVLTIEGDATTGPSDEEAALHLRRNGGKATTLNVKPGARLDVEAAGEIILDHARSLGCDLLVKSAYTRSRLRQRIFDGATRRILANASWPILTAH